MKRFTLFIISSILSVIAGATPPNLNVEKLFDGTYNNNKSVSIVISKNKSEHSYCMIVNNNESIVNKIKDYYNKDHKRADESQEMFPRSGGVMRWMVIINNNEKIEIGYMYDNKVCQFFIKGPAEAFK